MSEAPPPAVTIDTVASFMDYAKIKKTLAYELIHAEGFPCFRTSPRGKVLIERESAIAWMKRRGSR